MRDSFRRLRLDENGKAWFESQIELNKHTRRRHPLHRRPRVPKIVTTTAQLRFQVRRLEQQMIGMQALAMASEEASKTAIRYPATVPLCAHCHTEPAQVRVQCRWCCPTPATSAASSAATHSWGLLCLACLHGSAVNGVRARAGKHSSMPCPFCRSKSAHVMLGDLHFLGGF